MYPVSRLPILSCSPFVLCANLVLTNVTIDVIVPRIVVDISGTAFAVVQSFPGVGRF